MGLTSYLQGLEVKSMVECRREFECHRLVRRRKAVSMFFLYFVNQALLEVSLLKANDIFFPLKFLASSV